MHLIVASLMALSASQADKIELTRKFAAGEKMTYDFASRLDAEMREYPVETFFPDNVDFTYTFTLDVEKLKPDGVADVRFKRKEFKIRMAEDFESGPKTTVMTQNTNMLITFSNRNQILSIKDETPKKPPARGGGLHVLSRFGVKAQDPIMQMIQQLHSFAAFANFYDFGPSLPLHPVAVGDTWKETIGYTPMTISSGAEKGKSLMGRIDYVYTYKGNGAIDNKTCVWIQGKISVDTDAAPFIATFFERPEFSPFKEIKLFMDGTVDYYLEPANLATYKIVSKSEGNASISVKDYSGGPVFEERFKSQGKLVRK